MLSNQSYSCLEALKRFTSVQERHLAGLEGSQPSETGFWHHERERMFQQVQENFSAVNFEIMAPADRQVFFTAIKAILAREERLKRLVAMKKDELFVAISEIRKGRKSLQRYSATGCSGPEPRFLSSRM